MATHREWAMRSIPILVRWAQGTWDVPHSYKDFAYSVGFISHQMAAQVLEEVKTIINQLKTEHKCHIPSLNALVQNQDTGLPGIGFESSENGYINLSDEEKRIITRLFNEEAHNYDWNWVLKALNLKPAQIINDEELSKIKSCCFGVGGEGPRHKALKEYIALHPEEVKIKGVKIIKRVKYKKVEYDLLSGDRLDVYFECSNRIHFAVEVKPSTSSDDDIRRGIFQCIKYKSVMDAQRVVENQNYDNKAILVIEGTLSPENRQIARDLGVEYHENFIMKQ